MTARPVAQSFPDGLAICGTFPEPEVIDLIAGHLKSQGDGPLPLTIADPQYGNILPIKWDRTKKTDAVFADWMIDWTKAIAGLSAPRSGLYCFGGIGKPRDGKKPPFRAFYRYLVQVELETDYNLANHITWSKRRAYGVSHNYLFCREELAYLHLGPDVKKPRCFNIPLLEELRGYAGYSEKYPAKSEYLRRTNVWRDVSELFSGKVHVAQKPQRLMEIPIEIHTQPGETVLDPFAGSGVTAHAARRLGRRFILVEEDPVSFASMVARLRLTEPS